MAERTIDILLRLDADKKSSVQQLSKELEKMTAEAKRLEAALNDAIGRGATEEAKKLEQELKFTNGYLKAIDEEARKMELAKSLAAAEQRANKTREKMEKLAQVGNTLALTGAAILAPFGLAMKKYLDTTKEAEPTSRKILELSKRWEESQVKIGRITAEIVLPALEKALNVVDKIVAFAEENPGFVKAALGIGASLVVAGTLISTVASVVKTLATIQSLTAGLGIGTSAATTAAATGTAAVGGEAAIAAGVTTALGSAVFLAAVTFAAAEGTRQIFNAITGQNQTWADIGNTVKQLLVFSAEGWDLLFGFFGMETNFSTALSNLLNISDLNIGKYVTTSASSIISGLGKTIVSAATSVWTNIVNAVSSMASRIWEGIVNLGNSIVSSITGLFSSIPGKAGGGELSRPGLFKGAESGREFVMNNRTTKAAESIIGGKLTQERLLQALAGGRNVSYHDARRFDASVSANDRRMIRNDTMLMLSEALG